ncbi:MAG: copper homeostasis protein CutC [Flavobacteriaceae bacterium]|nr:copper homeostasis protein CutC [Flavobacteriaceae bacterium]MDZ4147830.1 copper homeostasis protein CutC [Flavobacteriaceae bacterium]
MREVNLLTMAKILLEAPVFNVESALQAEVFGIDRIELCADFSEGGTTPSVGVFSILKKKLSIPVFVMIRPRGGDFIYSKTETDAMLIDLKLFKSLGADGFVFGALHPDGTIDTSICQKLIEAAGSTPCTFHRAFDMTPNLEESLEILITLGFTRVLTSGGKSSVSSAMDVLQKLLYRAKNRIIVMPGGGLQAECIPPLSETGLLKEIHASCRDLRKGKNEYQNPNLSVFSDVLTINPDVVKGFKNIIQ